MQLNLPRALPLLALAAIATTGCSCQHGKVLDQPKLDCPNLQLGETATDCPWAGVARELQKKPAAEHATLLGILAPEILRQLTVDAQVIDVKEYWGESLNYDEFAKGTIVEEPILDGILSLAGAPPRNGLISHAGVEHTYGYLFSTLKTPYGFKRARWVNGAIEEGFGLPRGIFNPNPKDGTLLLNVTCFAGKIAFRKDLQNLTRLRLKCGPRIPAELQTYPFGELKTIRLEEITRLKKRTVSIYTDLVELPKPITGGSSHLLVYSYADTARPFPLLITMFPVNPDFVHKLTTPGEFGKSRPIQTRYNASIAGITGVSPPLKGQRTLWKPGQL